MSGEFEKTQSGTGGVEKRKFPKEVEELVSRLTLFDDDLMSRVSITILRQLSCC